MYNITKKNYNINNVNELNLNNNLFNPSKNNEPNIFILKLKSRLKSFNKCK